MGQISTPLGLLTRPQTGDPAHSKEGNMEIQLGRPVIAKDGERIGQVDRIVIDPVSMELVQFIVHKGLFLSEDRIIERPLIEHVGIEGTVFLAVASDFVEHLPLFVEHSFLAEAPPAETNAPYIVGIGGPDPNTVLTSEEPVGHDYQTFTTSIFEHAPSGGPRLEVRSNIPADAVLLSRGTDIVDADGDKIGALEKLIYQDGTIEGFVAESGLIERHQIRVPAADVESITHERIQLRRAQA